MTFSDGPIFAIGEAMVEMAPVDGLYRRSFAGDTFNTIWHLAQLCDRKTGFVTKIGTDAISDSFHNELTANEIDTDAVARDPHRTMGLYMIELTNAERSFTYWRGQSAARGLADDPEVLARSLNGAALVHFSGITLAILSPKSRADLFDVLADLRQQGTRICFDPNIRPRLWSSLDVARSAVSKALSVTDIALPSFDDEAQTWDDRTPADTLKRFSDAGVGEVVIKDGAGPVIWSDGHAETALVSGVIDTTGAGDAFNAGYLSARLVSADIAQAVSEGQRLSAAVICHFGARLPKEQLQQHRRAAKI